MIKMLGGLGQKNHVKLIWKISIQGSKCSLQIFKIRQCSNIIAFWGSEILEGFSQNKGDNLNFQKFNDFLDYFCILSRIVLKFGTEHLHNGQKSVFLNIVYFWFMLNLHEKIMNTNDFWSCFAIFSSKIGIKSKADNIWKVYFRFFA